MLRNPAEVTEVPSKALVDLIHAQRGHMSTRQRIDGAEVLVARSWARRRQFSTGTWAASAFAIGILAFGAVMSLRGPATSGALSYAVDGGHVGKGGVIAADVSSSPTLRFSDGTEVRLSPEANVALSSVDDHGARVALIAGSAHVDVVHKPGASWRFDAGPFLVVVTGTAFTVQWTPSDEQLDLRMERGTVEVSGPLSDGAVSLRSGQHLIVRVRQRETFIEEDIGEPRRPGLLNPPEEQPAWRADANAGTSGIPGIGSSALPHPSPSVGEREWPAAVARGDYETVVRQAERRGLDASLSEASSVDLAALADAARYARHDDLARQALSAQRRRFPLASAGRDASFLLGRLEETGRNVSGAVEWYDRYLTESPLGTYASEALGRKMTLIQQTYGDERARPLADAYVSRFPQGTYAAQARALAGAR